MSSTGKPIHVTKDTFTSEVVASEIPVVVDFWAPWCGPCKSIGPVLDKLASEYDGRVKVAKVNVDEEQDLATTHYIRGIPTLVVMYNGTSQGQMVGFRGAQAIEDLFAELADVSAKAPAQGVV